VCLQPDAHDLLIKKHVRQSLPKQFVSHLRAESQENAVSKAYINLEASTEFYANKIKRPHL